MNSYFGELSRGAVAKGVVAFVLTTAVVGNVQAESFQSNAIKILEADFKPRKVVQVEVGDFHFRPGQVAPVHTHIAPAVGYVLKGEIIYQVEGEKQQLLREGDAFYEPVGPRILRFDNASATEEAIFIDFNLEQEGEPFIVFAKPLVEKIDRRTLPTMKMDGQTVGKVSVYEGRLNAGQTINFNLGSPVLSVVAEGAVVIKESGKAARKVVKGGVFTLPNAGSGAKLMNASTEVPAKVITFEIL